MSSYSFDFEIERYQDKDTNEYLSNVPEGTDDDFEHDLVYIILEVKGSGYYSPGKYHAAPEDCYPDDLSAEIDSVVDDQGNDWYDKLTKNEISSIMEKLQTMIVDGSSYGDSYEDYSCDEWEYV